MFFKFDEKTLKEAIDSQRKREQGQKPSESVEPQQEYDGHKLKFITGSDGSFLIDSDPPLVKVLSVDNGEPDGDVDVLTPRGWVKKT